MNRNLLLFALVAVLFAATGMLQSWNSALGILNMALISAIMALGVNIDGCYDLPEMRSAAPARRG